MFILLREPKQKYWKVMVFFKIQDERKLFRTCGGQTNPNCTHKVDCTEKLKEIRSASRDCFLPKEMKHIQNIHIIDDFTEQSKCSVKVKLKQNVITCGCSDKYKCEQNLGFSSIKIHIFSPAPLHNI